MLEFLSAFWTGLLDFLKTSQGIFVLIAVLIPVIRKLILWTPTQIDDEIWTKYGSKIFEAAAVVEKAIPDGTQIPALKFVDDVTQALLDGNAVDVSNKKLMTVVKGAMIKIAEESKKINTTPEEVLKLKN